jgi:protein gp37
VGKTGISWTDDTWNPTKGCSRVSEGCRHCYAEVQAARIVRMGKGKPTVYDGLVSVRSEVSGLRYEDVHAAGSYVEPRWTGKVALDAKALALPLSWRAPRRIFVNSMSDLFHESLTNEQIAAVFGVMAACAAAHVPGADEARPADARVVRVARCRAESRRRDSLVAEPECCRSRIRSAQSRSAGYRSERVAAPQRLARRLRREPGGRRRAHPRAAANASGGAVPVMRAVARAGRNARSLVEDLDWIIAGCESGPGARPCSVEWLRSLRDQSAAAGVAFFLKQATHEPAFDAVTARADSKRKPGGVIELPYLDGVQHASFPEVP